MNAPEGAPKDSKAVVSMADKMQEIGLNRAKRTAYPPMLRQNVLTEIGKGMHATVAAKRFNVHTSTVYAWVSKQKKARNGALPRKAIQPPASDANATNDKECTVTLSALELKMLVTVMRDAMDRVKNPGTKGQLAVLAFKLMDLPGFGQ